MQHRTIWSLTKSDKTLTFSSLYETLKDARSTYILRFSSKRANGPIHSALEQVSITKNMLLGLMAALLLKSVCEKLHTQDKTLLSEATTSASGLDGSALVNRLVGFCGGFAVFWPPATWEHYVPSFWRMLFSRRHLGRNIGSPRFCFCCHFHQNVLPHNSEESISGLRKSVSSRYSVTDARRYTEIYLTYCHRGMGGLNSAKALYYRVFNWGKREASPVMAEQELGVLH